MSGLFITFEGIEGCGKTTQLEMLRAHLETRGESVEVTREPGGSPVAEAIRALVLDPRHRSITAMAEVLLYCAARAQHVEERIGPALAAGRVVLCDRFADSTTAYQGAGRAIDPADIASLHRIATRGAWPDLTLLLDLPVETGMARIRDRRPADRLELEPLAFHERVRDGFLRIAEADPDRVQVLDAAREPEVIAAEIRSVVDAWLGARP